MRVKTIWVLGMQIVGLGCGYVMGVAGDEPGQGSRGQTGRADVSG